MFEYNNTIITKCEFNWPEDTTRITGSCNVEAAIGIPENTKEIKNIRCRVNVTVTNHDSDVPLIDLIAISSFSVSGDILAKDELCKQAEQECIPVALKYTSEKIEDATKIFRGKGLHLPIYDE